MEILAPMFQIGWASRLGRRHVAHRGEAVLAKRAAAAGQGDLFDALDAGEIEALPDRVVLAVDRQQGRAVRRDLAHEQAAGADQHLLVGEGDDAPLADRRQGRLPARRRRRSPPSPNQPAARPRRPAPRDRRPPRCRCRRAPPSAPDNRPDRPPPRSARQAASPARPSSAALRLAVSASTVKPSRLRSSRSTVLCPTDPVEPRIVTRRGGLGRPPERSSSGVIAMPARCRRRRSGSAGRPPGPRPATHRAGREVRHARV